MSKKKLSRNQKRKQKKQRQIKQKQRPLNPEQRMLKRLKKSKLTPDKIVHNPPGVDKMSDVLFSFIEPYYDDTETTEDMHILIRTGILAWNTALLPPEKQEESLQKMGQSLPVATHYDFYAFTRELIERKNQYFAGYMRAIFDYELVEHRDGSYYITVVSTLPEETVGGFHDSETSE